MVLQMPNPPIQLPIPPQREIGLTREVPTWPARFPEMVATLNPLRDDPDQPRNGRIPPAVLMEMTNRQQFAAGMRRKARSRNVPAILQARKPADLPPEREGRKGMDTVAFSW